jgi:hypothetical protein
MISTIVKNCWHKTNRLGIKDFMQNLNLELKQAA